MPLALDDPLMPAQPGIVGRSGELRVKEPIRRFTRLAEIAGNPDDTLAIALTLGRGEHGWPRLEGRVEGKVRLTCQRCLGGLWQPVACELRLALVPEGGEELVPAGYEAWELPEDQRLAPRLRELIEDEVILALPLIARHAQPDDCGELVSRLVGLEQDEAAEAAGTADGGDRDNPFAVLKVLKDRD